MQDVRRVALVTGLTNGIGLAIAQRFGQLGYAVALNSFEPEGDIGNAMASVPAPRHGIFRPT